jgi:hypothetical protein
MLARTIRWGALAVMVAMGGVAHAADSLVIREGGAFKPGLAKSWSEGASGVAFLLADGVDPQKIAQTLSERLATVKVAVTEGKLVLSGLPLATLLDQLAGLSLAADADPLAELGAGGTAVASAAPEAGGSIRASRPSAFTFPGQDAVTAPTGGAPAAAAGAAGPHEPTERMEAEVLEVRRGEFPSVVLKLRVRKAAGTGPLAKPLHRGSVFEGTPVFVGAPVPLDLGPDQNRRNLAAYYLAPGDRVVVHALVGATAEPLDRLSVDWIERAASVAAK